MKKIEAGPNWDDDLGGSPIYAANDPNLENLDPAERHWAVHTETTTIPITVRELQAVIN